MAMTENTTDRDERTLTERVDPILVPQRIQQLRVETALEDGDVELVVRVCVNAEIFDFVQGDRLVLGC
jgi:hypothetical protein